MVHEGEEEERRKRGMICGEGKYLVHREKREGKDGQYLENEKDENIWSTEEKKNREGKGGDILRRKRRGIF